MDLSFNMRIFASTLVEFESRLTSICVCNVEKQQQKWLRKKKLW